MTRYLDRRQFAFGCACCASTVSFPQATPASAPTFQGCLISSEGYQQYRTNAEGLYGASDGLIAPNRHFRTTGDPALDRDLDKALGVIADLFSVDPAFGFYDSEILDMMRLYITFMGTFDERPDYFDRVSSLL